MWKYGGQTAVFWLKLPAHFVTDERWTTANAADVVSLKGHVEFRLKIAGQALFDQFSLVLRLSQAPLKLAANSYKALAEYLVRPAKNDIGKIRSFYYWIASQRLQKVVDFVDNKLPPEDTPLYTVLLTLVKQWGNGYSELFTKLCE